MKNGIVRYCVRCNKRPVEPGQTICNICQGEDLKKLEKENGINQNLNNKPTYAKEMYRKGVGWLYTDEEDEIIIQMRKDGHKFREIGKELNRHPDGVNKRYINLIEKNKLSKRNDELIKKANKIKELTKQRNEGLKTLKKFKKITEEMNKDLKDLKKKNRELEELQHTTYMELKKANKISPSIWDTRDDETELQKFYSSRNIGVGDKVLTFIKKNPGCTYENIFKCIGQYHSKSDIQKAITNFTPHIINGFILGNNKEMRYYIMDEQREYAKYKIKAIEEELAMKDEQIEGLGKVIENNKKRYQNKREKIRELYQENQMLKSLIKPEQSYEKINIPFGTFTIPTELPEENENIISKIKHKFHIR